MVFIKQNQTDVFTLYIHFCAGMIVHLDQAPGIGIEIGMLGKFEMI